MLWWWQVLCACSRSTHSGATQARARWKECLDYLQSADVLVVADLTRLGRCAAWGPGVTGNFARTGGAPGRFRSAPPVAS
ncbi:recombinase family protein [Arthrobacter sp. NPDC093125]|uniref:recombinase family protein n=1 Tax=Arthrobacter sp. NPDC093125 TaxID=3363944 RepID=UPI0037FCE70B